MAAQHRSNSKKVTKTRMFIIGGLTVGALAMAPASIALADDSAPTVPATDISLTQDIHRGQAIQGTLDAAGTQGGFRNSTLGTIRIQPVSALPKLHRPSWWGKGEASIDDSMIGAAS